MKVLNHFTPIELTHPLNAKIPTWDGSCGFQHVMLKDYDQLFRTQKIAMQAGAGTHMDAPCHCIPGGHDISEISLHQLIVPVVVIDVSSVVHEDYVISMQDILDFETRHGKIPSNSFVIAYTGWDQFWNDPSIYCKKDELGKMHFPSYSAEAAQLLVKRDVAGIGIDTISPDVGLEGKYPVHEIILGKGKYIVENVANAHKLPPIGASVIVLPLNFQSGTESPVRMIGLIPSIQ